MRERILNSIFIRSLSETHQQIRTWLTFGKLLAVSIIAIGVIFLGLSFSEAPETVALRYRVVSFWGLFLLMGIAWLLSNNRSAIDLRIIASGLFLQLAFALLILNTTAGQTFFKVVGDAMTSLLTFTNKGSSFLFGEKLLDGSLGFVFAFQVLPTLIFVSSLTAILYYFGVLQVIVGAMARVMSKAMKISGAESLSCAVNVFIGQTEAPLFVRPYVSKMTNSELMTLMTGGFATIAGAVMAAYAMFLQKAGLHSGAGHLLCASVISAPAAILMAKIIYPETETSETAGHASVRVPVTDVNVLDAATRGASEGLRLAVNVGGMLLAFIALIAMVNFAVGDGLDKLLVYFGFSPYHLTLQKIFGWLFSPLAWMMGVPWDDCLKVGSLLGVKTVVNEFVAYLDLSEMVKSQAISPRSQIIAIYALCGFSNFSSIAIQLGGIGTLAPERRGDLAQLGLKAMIAGSLACFMTANIVGILI